MFRSTAKRSVSLQTLAINLFSLVAYHSAEKGKQAPRTVYDSTGFLISAEARPRFSTV